jgi:mono/diheme cytochrome c family protein
MKRNTLILGAVLVVACAGCNRNRASFSTLQAKATGAALVESSGGKQLGTIGSQLAQPIVVQLNDDQGASVTGALVRLSGPSGVVIDPAEALTDSSGQVTANVTLGGMAGRYELTATSVDKAGKSFQLKVQEIAAGYQQQLGYTLEEKYCVRCHNSESSAERVSNFGNLAVKPHGFTEGDTLNTMSDADLTAIISHGGPALNRSALMPPYGSTLSKSDIQAIIAYIRLVSDPPYRAAGVVYAQQ